jgi:hypothetical protein
MEDLRHIIDYFSVRSPLHSTNPEVYAQRARKIKGVRVHCRGDEELQFEIIEYPQDHPIFRVNLQLTLDGQFSIFDMLGLPLISEEKPLDVQLNDDPRARCLQPWVASVYKFLTPAINPGSIVLKIETRKQLDVNFVRADGKDLHEEHVEALFEFIDLQVLPVNRDRELLVPSMLGPRGHILDVVTPEKFDRYWEQNFQRDDLSNPYDVV